MIRRVIQTGLFSMAAVALTATLAMAQSQTTKPFGGAKVNGGTAVTPILIASHTVLQIRHVTSQTNHTNPVDFGLTSPVTPA